MKHLRRDDIHNDYYNTHNSGDTRLQILSQKKQNQLPTFCHFDTIQERVNLTTGNENTPNTVSTNTSTSNQDTVGRGKPIDLHSILDNE